MEEAVTTIADSTKFLVKTVRQLLLWCFSILMAVVD